MMTIDRRRRALLCLAGLLAGLCVGSAVYAQTAPAKKDDITFSAKNVQSVLAKGKERTVLVGQARVVIGKMTIVADRIEMTGENYRNIACSGAASVDDKDNGFTLTSTSLRYDRSTQLGVAEGNVVLNDTKNNVIMDSGWLQFDQKQSLIQAKTGVHILKEDFVVRAEFATFNRSDETLTLSGAPSAATGDGALSASSITGSTGSDNLSFNGNVSGTISTKSEGNNP